MNGTQDTKKEKSSFWEIKGPGMCIAALLGATLTGMHLERALNYLQTKND
jgi:hypothetical protein